MEVETSTDPGLTGIRGQVVDETRNLLVVRQEDGRVVRVPKRTATFRLAAEDGAAVIDGRVLAHRPEDRPKKIRMKHLRDDGNASSKEEGQEGSRGKGHRRRR